MPYRDSVPAGTLVLSSGLGGVYPKGIPVGTVTGVVREQAGWERVYRLLPAANPGGVAHVLVLVSPPGSQPGARLPQRLGAARDAARLDRQGPRRRLARGRQGPRADSLAAAKAPGLGHRPPAARVRRDSMRRGLGPVSASRANRIQLVLVMALLVLLHFYLRPRLWSARVSPDFLLIALVFFAMRAGPGAGAVAGFVVGLVNDALTPAAFGAGALAHTVVGYLAAWGRAVFFADNLLVNAAFVAVALWVRDLLLLVASGTAAGPAAGGADPEQPAPGPVHRGLRPAGPGGVPRVVRHQARRMNGFDSYRVRERADIAQLVLVAAFVLLGGAFFRTQIIQHEKFQLRAETNRLRPISLTPPRGTIFDRNGGVIAENVPGYSVKVLAPSVDSLRAVIARIGRVRARSTPPRSRRSSAGSGRPAISRPWCSATPTFETIARLEEHRAVLPGW